MGEVIGRGGMGTVYSATDLTLDRVVAVKVLPPAVADQDLASIARFKREARAAASLAHPGVVAVFDTGADDGTHFIVMELVSGRSLAAILREEAPLDPARAVEITGKVADALAAAHAAGVVHRDVKPSNLMVAEDGSIRVLDFGIVRLMDGTAITQTASVLGSAAYMSPEQALGKRVEERSDIYSLGCVLYALLAGRPPFAAEAAAAIVNQHVNADPQPLRMTNRLVPPALEALVMQMLTKSPAARPSAAQLGNLLSETLAEPPPTATLPITPSVGSAETTVTRLQTVGARGRRRWVVGGVLVTVLGLIAAIALASETGSPPHGVSKRQGTGSSTPTRRSPPPTTGTPTSPGISPNAQPSGPAKPKPSKEQGETAVGSPGPPAKPPGHGGVPPGQEKKQNDGSDSESEGG